MHAMYIDANRITIENNVVSGIVGWAVQRVTLPSNAGPDVISNNTFFDNGGGIVIDENNGVQGPPWDYSTISNNIIVNSSGSGGQFGIDYFHATGMHNLVTNNMIYSNLPADLGHHGGICTADTPPDGNGLPMTGTDGNGNAGGCPSSDNKTDARASQLPLPISRAIRQTLPPPTTTPPITSSSLAATPSTRGLPVVRYLPAYHLAPPPPTSTARSDRIRLR